jgi:integrase/recombinase XerD
VAEQLVLPGVGDFLDARNGAPERLSAPRRLIDSSSLPAAVGAFEVHMREQGFAENTNKAFVSDLGLLTQFVGAGKAVGEISTPDLRRFTYWLAHERGVPCSSKSLARRVTALKVFFGWLAEAGVIRSNPADAVVHSPVSSPLPYVPSDSEVERVLAVTQAQRYSDKPDARPHLLVTLLLHTGIKKGECMNVVLNHLDFEDPDHPVLWIRYNNPQRRHKERELALPVDWPAALAEYQVQYRPQDTLFPCTARNLEYVLAGVGRQAELPHQLSFGMLRWTCAVRDSRAGISAERLRQKLGISSITWRDVGARVAQLATSRLDV